MKKKKMNAKWDKRWLILFALLAASLALTFFCYPLSLWRLWMAIKDVGTSVAYYFCYIFEDLFDAFYWAPNVTPSVTVAPDVDFFTLLPIEWEAFKAKLAGFFPMFFNGENFKAWLLLLANVSEGLSRFLILFGIPFGIVFWVLVNRMLDRHTSNVGEQSKQLRRWLCCERKIFIPVLNWVRSFVAFSREKRIFVKLFLGVWLLNFNILTVAIEALAYYFYFAATFDFANLYIQLYKLFIDVVIMFNGAPFVFWLAVAFIFFNWLGKKIGYQRLNHMEAFNCGYINSLPICSINVGLMGTGKTLTLTDMALSQEKMFRQKAFDMLLEENVKFPDFHFLRFEKDIRRAIAAGQVYSLASAREYIAYLREKVAYRFILHPERETLVYGYSLDKCKPYNDDLALYPIWTMLENYIQLYVIYIVQSSLMVTNYSIRTDAILQNEGNFPLWAVDFFKSDPNTYPFYSRHSHILDMDILRLAKTMVENSKLSGSFEFGVIGITEFGKDRGNQQTNMELKKNAPEANPKNDGFVQSLKFIRHFAEILGVCFAKFFSDDQRAESLNADNRDLCYITAIRSKSPRQICRPFFELYDIFHAAVWGWFVGVFSRYRFNRADDTLFWYLTRKFVYFVHRHYIRTHNRFDFMQLEIEITRGKIDAEPEKGKYYLSTKKLYSNRYNTACFQEIFGERSLKTGVGIEDYREFESTTATVEELESMHQYFTKEIFKDFDK